MTRCTPKAAGRLQPVAPDIARRSAGPERTAKSILPAQPAGPPRRCGIPAHAVRRAVPHVTYSEPWLATSPPRVARRQRDRSELWRSGNARCGLVVGPYAGALADSRVGEPARRELCPVCGLQTVGLRDVG